MTQEANLSRIESDFQRVYNKAISSGITCEQISSLRLFRQLSNCAKPNFMYNAIILVVIAFAAIPVYRHSSETIAKGLDNICSRLRVDTEEAMKTDVKDLPEAVDLTKEEVQNIDEYIEDTHDYTEDSFEDDNIAEEIMESERKEEFCDVCSVLKSVQRVVNITPDDFESRFAYSGVPLVVSDGMRDWRAPETFSLDFFRKLYGNSSDTLRGEEPGCSFFPYDTGFESLEEAFQVLPTTGLHGEGGKPWYIGWSNCDESVGSELRQHYRRPYFLPIGSELLETDWIFMGSPGYGAPLHLDSVGYPSWQAQVKGSKLWLLEPPPECAAYCRPLRVILSQGDIIVLDTNLWYHETLILGDTLSITIGAEYD